MNVPLTLLAGTTTALGVLAVSCWRLRVQARVLRRRLEQSAQDLQQLQMAFSRFAPDEVIERVIADGVEARGEKREVTVLFADLVGFTALGETLDPSVLVRVLNGYFARMSTAISLHRGHVSKFIGDGILALFGALAPNPWQADDAVHAGLAMVAALEDYNRELAAEGLPTLALGVGIHRGAVVAGLVGSRDLMEFTVVGATVNLAARVQSLTRDHDGRILVTAAVSAALDPRFRLRPLGEVGVKGVREPVRVVAVDGFALP
jgi:adenylate cyclase